MIDTDAAFTAFAEDVELQTFLVASPAAEILLDDYCSSTGVTVERVPKITAAATHRPLDDVQTVDQPSPPFVEAEATIFPTTTGAIIADTLDRQFPMPDTNPTRSTVTSR